MATIQIFHIQATDFLLGNIEALNSDNLCDRLSYLPTVNFDKVCSFPLIWTMNSTDLLNDAFAVTNQMSPYKDLNDWYNQLQHNHGFRSGSAGDLYLIKEIDSDHKGYLALPLGWQSIKIDPIQHMLNSAVRYEPVVLH
jgi:hypothetical protein